MMRPFLDTNVLIYAVDPADAAKQAVAQRLLSERGLLRPTISTQVLGEAYNVLNRRRGWAADEALAAVRTFASLPVVVANMDTVMAGLALAAQHRLSGWDALIVQTALQAGCDTLYSEDMQAGRRFGNLQIVNPFVLGAHEAVPASAPPSAPRRKAGPKAIRRRAV